jgi:uncharacterized protein (TIGR03089 family)
VLVSTQPLDAAEPLLTIVDVLGQLVARNSGIPFLTYYDDATGERTELSVATLDNWVAKTANLLVDGAGLGPGDLAQVLLPPHWQAAAVLLGCWRAGLTVVARGDQSGGGHAQVGFATAASAQQLRADERYALSLEPLGMAFRSGPPDGMLDYVIEVRGFADHHTGPWPGLDTPATQALTHRDLIRSGREHAGALPTEADSGRRAARVLIDGDAVDDPLDWLVAPMLAGASIVLCRNLDPAALPKRLVSERATLRSVSL